MGLVNSLYFFGKQRPDLRPALALVSLQTIKEIAHFGFLFFVLQIVVAVNYSSDNLIIAHQYGAAAVSAYSVPDRLFALISLIVGFAVNPLWPAFAEAMSRGDVAWASKTLFRGTRIALLLALVSASAMVLAGPTILKLWVGSQIAVPLALLAGMALWRVVEATANAPSMFLNAIQAVRFQIAIAIVTALVSVILKIVLVRLYPVWVLPLITAGTYVVCAGIPIAIYLKRYLK